MTHQNDSVGTATAKHIFRAIRKDTILLRALLAEYETLFLPNDGKRHDQERLLRHASGFISILGQVIPDYLILGVSRLVDPPRTGKHENLSLHRLADALNAEGHSGLAKPIREAIASRRKEIEVIRLHRMKRLAHLDLRRILKGGEAADELDAVTFNHIRSCLEDFHKVLNGCEAVLENATTSFNVAVRGSANSLLSRLRKAERYDQLRKKCQNMHSQEGRGVEVRFDMETAELIWD
ncbi:MAG: hypothetical protein IH830_07650 [Planctomycetes bacterium]|nr:hypothetical protein [Planctomycetota bacterium]